MATHPADGARRFFLRPPDNFRDLPEEDQLAWARQVGTEMAAALGAEGDTRDPAEAAEDDDSSE